MDNQLTQEAAIQETIAVIEQLLQDEGAKKVARGKVCPSCRTKVGCRTNNCACGYEFQIGYKTPEALSPEQEQSVKYAAAIGGSHISYRIDVPRGDPPVNLPEITQQAINEWADHTVSYGMSRNVLYMPSALRYWLRYFVNINTEEYSKAKQMLQKWVQNYG